MSLWVPPRVSRELSDVTEQHKAEVMASAIRDASIEYFNRELKRVDEHLELIKAKDDATAAGLKPGYWHILRHNPGAPPSLLPLVGDDGEFVEPSSRVFDLLREGDLQNDQVIRAMRERDERAAKQRARDKQRDAEDRIGHMVEHAKAVTRAHVSMTDARPWTNAAKDSAK